MKQEFPNTTFIILKTFYFKVAKATVCFFFIWS